MPENQNLKWGSYIYSAWYSRQFMPSFCWCIASIFRDGEMHFFGPYFLLFFCDHLKISIVLYTNFPTWEVPQFQSFVFRPSKYFQHQILERLLELEWHFCLMIYKLDCKCLWLICKTWTFLLGLSWIEQIRFCCHCRDD